MKKRYLLIPLGLLIFFTTWNAFTIKPIWGWVEIFLWIISAGPIIWMERNNL